MRDATEQELEDAAGRDPGRGERRKPLILEAATEAADARLADAQAELETQRAEVEVAADAVAKGRRRRGLAEGEAGHDPALRWRKRPRSALAATTTPRAPARTRTGRRWRSNPRRSSTSTAAPDTMRWRAEPNQDQRALSTVGAVKQATSAEATAPKDVPNGNRSSNGNGRRTTSPSGDPTDAQATTAGETALAGAPATTADPAGRRGPRG